MKKTLVVAISVCILAFAGMAQAVPFTVNGITFDNLVGNAENFTWSVTPVGGSIAFNLNVGQSATFTYGTFYTSDFGLDTGDRNDNDDRFRANFDVQPPTPPSDLSRIGAPDAGVYWVWDYVSVDFNNDAIIVPFGIGGSYSVTFLDPDTLWADGSTNLQARITLISDAQAVPEPTTMLLMGLGLLGLAGVRRFRK